MPTAFKSSYDVLSLQDFMFFETKENKNNDGLGMLS
jgi:hypothetical protein